MREEERVGVYKRMNRRGERRGQEERIEDSRREERTGGENRG
jgi:hypothetical protein